MRLPLCCTRGVERAYEYRLKRRYYRNADRRFTGVPTLVSMIDGRVHHAGLADRLWGIMTTYYVSRESGYPFRIHYTSPFRLEDFLVPNRVDWRAGEADIDDNRATPVFIRSLLPPRNEGRMRQLRKAIGRCRTEKIHVYNNLKAFPEGEFASLFHDLFKPSPLLQAELDRHRQAIGGDYISCSFRFQQLLGDFTDAGANPPLPQDKRRMLIDGCIARLRSLYESGAGRYARILVASDSRTFLDEAARLPFVYIIPGRVVHVQFSGSDAAEGHLKTFVDMMMIAGARESYLIKGEGMYESGFPKFASSVTGHPFKVIECRTYS